MPLVRISTTLYLCLKNESFVRKSKNLDGYAISLFLPILCIYQVEINLIVEVNKRDLKSGE